MYRFATSPNRPRAFGLMVILVMLGIISMIAASVTLRTQSSLQASQRQTRDLSGEDAAFSGLQVALASVEATGETWPGFTSTQAMPKRTQLGYRVKTNSNTSTSSVSIDSDGTEIPPKSVYVKSVGYLDTDSVSGLTAIVSQEEGMTFNYPAFATNRLSLSNSTVDAVDAAGLPMPGEAPIRTNGDGGGAISLHNSSFVDGDVTVGKLADPAVALRANGGSGFAGTANIAGRDLPLPDVFAAYDDGAPRNVAFDIHGNHFSGFLGIQLSTPAPGTYSTLGTDTATIGGRPSRVRVLVLADGDYYANNFRSDGTTTYIMASGGTRLHVRDSVDFSALRTFIGSSTGPGLQIFQTSAGGAVRLDNTSGKVVVNAKGEMSVSNSSLSGALYGTNMDIRDSRVTYRTELDGLSINANVDGKWRLFGTRRMTPDEVSSF